MIELYFLFYRIPVMMTRLARERKRSALGWAFIAIAAWLGTEVAVALLIGIGYAFLAVFLDWPVDDVPVGLRFITYVVALLAALGSLTIVRRFLIAISQQGPLPPPPPEF